MTGPVPLLDRPLFEDLPDDLGEEPYRFGLLLPGMGSLEGVEVARSFLEAAERLLDRAREQRESWEAAYPIMFCYRHALELFLKALVANPKRCHGLGDLWVIVAGAIEGRYRSDQIAWLGDRIAEWDSIDPRSTGFRYADAELSVPFDGLWADFHHLRGAMTLVYEALERIHRDS